MIFTAWVMFYFGKLVDNFIIFFCFLCKETRKLGLLSLLSLLIFTLYNCNDSKENSNIESITKKNSNICVDNKYFKTIYETIKYKNGELEINEMESNRVFIEDCNKDVKIECEDNNKISEIKGYCGVNTGCYEKVYNETKCSLGCYEDSTICNENCNETEITIEKICLSQSKVIENTIECKNDLNQIINTETKINDFETHDSCLDNNIYQISSECYEGKLSTKIELTEDCNNNGCIKTEESKYECNEICIENEIRYDVKLNNDKTLKTEREKQCKNGVWEPISDSTSERCPTLEKELEQQECKNIEDNKSELSKFINMWTLQENDTYECLPNKEKFKTCVRECYNDEFCTSWCNSGEVIELDTYCSGSAIMTDKYVCEGSKWSSSYSKDSCTLIDNNKRCSEDNNVIYNSNICDPETNTCKLITKNGPECKEGCRDGRCNTEECGTQQIRDVCKTMENGKIGVATEVSECLNGVNNWSGVYYNEHECKRPEEGNVCVGIDVIAKYIPTCNNGTCTSKLETVKICER